MDDDPHGANGNQPCASGRCLHERGGLWPPGSLGRQNRSLALLLEVILAQLGESLPMVDVSREEQCTKVWKKVFHGIVCFLFYFFLDFLISFLISFSLSLFFCLLRAIPTAFGGSQAGGPNGIVPSGLHHSHSNMGSEPCLRPITTAHSRSLTH